jgi:hypothetical protein
MRYIDILIEASKRRAAEEAALVATSRPANAATAGKQLDYLEWLFKSAKKDVGLAKFVVPDGWHDASRGRPDGIGDTMRLEFLFSDGSMMTVRGDDCDPWPAADAFRLVDEPATAGVSAEEKAAVLGGLSAQDMADGWVAHISGNPCPVPLGVTDEV